MILVRITGWSSGTAPNLVSDAIRRSLTDAGIEKSDMDLSLSRLLHGKSVDIYFDLGEHKAARKAMRELHDLGLKSEFIDDKEHLFPASTPWILKTLLCC